MYKQFVILSIIVLITSCSLRRNKQDVIIHTVKRTNFVDQVPVTGFVESSKTVTISCPEVFEASTIIYLIEEGTVVKSGDTVCILESIEIKKNYDEALKKLETAEIEFTQAKARQQIQYLLLESEEQIIESSLSISELDSTQIRFSPENKQKLIKLDIKKSEIEKEKVQKKYKFSREINDYELKKLEMKIFQAENHVSRMRGMMDKLILTSPSEGKIIYAENWITDKKNKEGDNVFGRMPIVIIPDMENLQIDLEMSESIHKRIDVDDSVVIKIDAMPDLIFGGKITKKNPMGRKIDRDIEVKVFHAFSSISRNGIPITPGLSATCNVILYSARDTIAIPSVSVFEGDSTKFVYFASGRRFEKKMVELGESNEAMAIIKKGLEEGEIIALSKPPDKLIKN